LRDLGTMHPQFCSVIVIFFTFLCFANGELLITQVVEGSGFNKIVAFTNRGTTSVDLNDYTLWTAFNGDEWGKIVEPLARKSLGPGESFTLCNPGVSRAAVGHCDATSGDLKFNGNDAVGLSSGGEFVDLFGDEGRMGWNARGNAFRIDGVDDGSLDHTVVRKEIVTRGNTNWAVSSRLEWDVLHKDTFVVDGNTISLGRRSGGGTPSEGSTPDGPEGVCKQKSGPEIDFCANPKSPGEDRRPDKGELVIGTFNVEWLFDGESDTSRSRWHCDHEGAALHLQAVAGIIRRNKPDILGLEEVEDCTRLAELAALLPGYEGYLVQGTDSSTQQDTALLTRVDPSHPLYRTDEREGTPAGSRCGAHDDSTGVSKHFIARFPSLEGIPFKFAIIGVHLKAFPTDARSCAQREGQAKVLQNETRRLIDDGYEVAIMGDINDLSDLHRTRICSRESKPTSRVLSMFRDLNNDGVDDLRNAIEFVEVKERYSSRFFNDQGEEKLSLIDHVLLTPKLWGLVDRVWIDHTGADMPHEARVSDHWPILVALRTDGSPGSGVVNNPPPCV